MDRFVLLAMILAQHFLNFISLSSVYTEIQRCMGIAKDAFPKISNGVSVRKISYVTSHRLYHLENLTNFQRFCRDLKQRWSSFLRKKANSEQGEN